ncbi:hypothetical protein OG339_47225 (plasmid) [Streptosporangium sp. NBC_01495]|uniref:hypothetical protein n=1 Tax=Streptosporangium sp. NBC_01495 TaxID=2903899 RepID=UPI002E32B8E8|nr:hypothetical protein [Streptosporangium sp. NBC_01495]
MNFSAALVIGSPFPSNIVFQVNTMPKGEAQADHGTRALNRVACPRPKLTIQKVADKQLELFTAAAPEPDETDPDLKEHH